MNENPYMTPASSYGFDRSSSLQRIRWIALAGIVLSVWGLSSTLPMLVSPPESINPRYYVVLRFLVPIQLLLLVSATMVLLKLQVGLILLKIYAWLAILLYGVWHFDRLTVQLSEHRRLKGLPEEAGLSEEQMGAMLQMNLLFLFISMLLFVAYPLVILLFVKPTKKRNGKPSQT